uniref:Germin-like protein n=1 Tax=Nicotiana attenuata TaxID=49451 RepID=A0A0K0K6J6_NICAT|nr:nectarin 1b [Nicotiana attenuata]
MEANSAITMTLCLLISTIFLSSFACAFHLKGPEAAVLEKEKIYEDSKLVNANDYFASSALNPNQFKPLANYDGIYASVVDARTIPAINTIGITIIRSIYEPLALVPLHSHPQFSELMTVLEGSLYVGFLVPNSSNLQKTQLVSKILNAGDVFVFPQGHIHFQYNVGNTSATLIQAFNGANYISAIVPSSIFASDPPISDDYLAKAFKLDKMVIEDLRKKFS